MSIESLRREIASSFGRGDPPRVHELVRWDGFDQLDKEDAVAFYSGKTWEDVLAHLRGIASADYQLEEWSVLSREALPYYLRAHLEYLVETLAEPECDEEFVHYLFFELRQVVSDDDGSPFDPVQTRVLELVAQEVAAVMADRQEPDFFWAADIKEEVAGFVAELHGTPGDERDDRMQDLLDGASKLIRPGKGRYDLSALLASPPEFVAVVRALAHPFRWSAVDRVVGIDAAGFPFAACVSLQLLQGLVLIRTAGKVAGEAVQDECVDYTGARKRFELARAAIRPGHRVLLVDDWAKTGAQLAMARRLVEGLGGVVMWAACVNIDEAVREHAGLEGVVLHTVFKHDGVR